MIRIYGVGGIMKASVQMSRERSAKARRGKGLFQLEHHISYSREVMIDHYNLLRLTCTS